MNPKKIVINTFGRCARIVIRNTIDRKRLNNHNFTILSQNCIGGIMSHDLGERFNSPTINMFFSASDFLSFCKKIDWYLSKKIKFLDDSAQSKSTYPIGILDDIILNFVHYKSKNEAMEKWEERKRRINRENLFIVMTDRDGFQKKHINEFDSLEFENKVLFSSSHLPGVRGAVHVSNSTHLGEVGDLAQINTVTGLRGYQHSSEFDYVKWLNKKY